MGRYKFIYYSKKDTLIYWSADDYNYTLSLPNNTKTSQNIDNNNTELDILGLYVRSSLFIDKTMLDRAPLQCFSKTKDCRFVKPENWVSKLNSRTGLGLYVGSSHPKTLSEMTKSACKKEKSNCRIFFLVDSGQHSNFSVKKYVWCSIAEKPFFNITNQFVIERVPRRWVQVLEKSPIMTPIQSAWINKSGN